MSYGYGGYGGHGGGFALIVVLFVLLIIVGAGGMFVMLPIVKTRFSEE
jgi:uncharacterized protein (TIGR01732 family)